MKELFLEKPEKWGFRGDINLWDALEQHSSGLPMPVTKEELSIKLHQMFQELTGYPLQRGNEYYVCKYDTGGMSSGVINCDFWIDKAFPMLLARHGQLHME